MSELFDSGKLLRVYLGETDKLDGKPLFEALVEAAREAGLTGATVMRGIESFGRDGTTHTARLLRLAEDLPLVVEIVDRAETIDLFAIEVDRLMTKADCGGVVTMDEVLFKNYHR